ncbi:MAG: hypothetical protein C4522_22375 [Desulfobacteraceae bacterium]|nr:MAG: hypothetical protein C4522_22375 [Desulfobacteraceae bacterium]
MIDALDLMALEDDRDRRSGNDRRFLSYDIYLPDRRHAGERRTGNDRRKRMLTDRKPKTNQATA